LAHAVSRIIHLIHCHPDHTHAVDYRVRFPLSFGDPPILRSIKLFPSRPKPLELIGKRVNRQFMVLGRIEVVDVAMPRIDIPTESTTGAIHTLVIDLHESSRAKWLAICDFDEVALEACEQQAIREDERLEKEARDAAEAAKLAAIRTNRPRAVIGHDREGRSVYDDSRMMTNWAD